MAAMKLNHILVTVLLSACAAQADTLFNNFSAASGSDDYVTSNGHSGPLGASFSTGAYGFTFDSLALSLQSIDPSDGGMVTVSLASDSASGPGSSLYTLGTVNDSDLTSLNAEFDINGFGSIALAGNTRYWIELSDSLGSSMQWEYAADNSGIGAASESYYYGGNVFPDSDGGYVMSVDGTTATPEPATFAIAMIGLVGLAALTKRNRSLIQ